MQSRGGGRAGDEARQGDGKAREMAMQARSKVRENTRYGRRHCYGVDKGEV
jgi:hypothetical protein